MSQFVHLNVHTDRSLYDSLVSVGSLVSTSAEHKAPAVAITDHMNMFGQIGFYQKALAAGIKPISATEIRVRDGLDLGVMTLYATSNAGYKNLMALISYAYDEGFEGDKDDYPVLTKDIIEQYSGDLIALSGARHGLVGQALMASDDEASSEKTDRELQWMRSTFGRDNIFLELQRTGLSTDEDHVHRAVNLANRSGIAVVATNPVRFIDQKDFRAHEIRSAISMGITQFEFNRLYGDRYTPHMYLKTADEMEDLFDDIPSALDNTVTIARRCSVDLEFGKNFLPEFPIPQGQTESEFLRSESFGGLDRRLDFDFGLDNPDISSIRESYDQRLEYELGIINKMGFPGYFLIVADFIQWSKDNGIPVGPGRGSGAGSLVAYSLGITDLDPLKYDLLFERFLNPERVSMPDFDVDFCMDRRDEVIAYVANKYGHEAVSQIVTFGTLAARMVVKDVARALGYPFRVGAKISGLIPDEPGIKITDALENEVAFNLAYRDDQEVKEVVDIALRMEGLARQTGKHAGGVLIAPGKLTDYTPTYNNKDGDGFVSQYNMGDVETAGLVKFDFLGLRTLTIIQNAVDSINKRSDRETPLDMLGVPLDDDKVFDIFREGRTSAVFQVESHGMKELLRRLKPDSYEDLIALVALYRPGPLQSGMVDNFINRKHGREEISYPDSTYQHESLKPILDPTYGIILYQEQVMQIAQVLAGYTLGQADLLRRAMGKKKPEEMAKQRTMFAEGAKNNGIDPDLAMKIFDLVEKFAGYGFNKSHSAAYALISYQTGWLKHHYPSEFMASVMSSDMDKTEKVVGFINEARSMGLQVDPPSVNNSGKHFVALKDGSIVYGLGAIKGVGGAALNKIIDERELNGPYKGFQDFVYRVNPNVRVLKALIKSGAMTEFGHNRETLLQNAAVVQKYARAQIDVDKGKAPKKASRDLFDSEDSEKAFGKGDENIHALPGFMAQKEMHEIDLLMGEKATLGLFLSGHPMSAIRKDIPDISENYIGDVIFNPSDASEANLTPQEGITTLSGVIMDLDVRTQKKGNVAYFKLDDGTGRVTVRVFSKTFNDCQHILKDDQVVSIEGRIRHNKKSGAQDFIAADVKDLKMIRDAKFAGIAIDMDPSDFDSEARNQLQEIINRQTPGLAKIQMRVTAGDKSRLVPVGDREVSLTDELVHELRGLFGESSVSLLTRESLSPKEQSANNRRAHAEKLEEGRQTYESRMAERAKYHEELKQAMGL